MKNTKNTHYLTLVLAVLSLLAAPAQGAVVVSNLGEVNELSFASVCGAGPGPSGGFAGSFTVDSQNYFLNQATLRLGADNEFGPTEFHAYIYSNSSNETGIVPGSVLYDLGTRSHTGMTFLDHDFLAPGNSLLSANTTYWLVTTTVCGRWSATLSDNETGQAGWSIGDTARFFVVMNTGDLQFHPFPSDYKPLFAIDATAVPEPVDSGLVAVMICAGTAIWWRRTRCRAQNPPSV